MQKQFDSCGVAFQAIANRSTGGARGAAPVRAGKRTSQMQREGVG